MAWKPVTAHQFTYFRQWWEDNMSPLHPNGQRDGLDILASRDTGEDVLQFRPGRGHDGPQPIWLVSTEALGEANSRGYPA